VKMVRSRQYVASSAFDRPTRLTLFQLSTTILDATRISDGTYVSLKSLSKSIHPYEADIGTYLTSRRLASDPANHCVPIIEVLNVPDVEDRIILVMPLLRKYDKPNFQTIGEAVDFFTQTFEVCS
jgi:hypothetical protein